MPAGAFDLRPLAVDFLARAVQLVLESRLLALRTFDLLAQVDGEPPVTVQIRADGRKRKLIAFLTDGVVVRKILDHLGLDSEPPILAPPREFAQSGFAW